MAHERFSVLIFLHNPDTSFSGGPGNFLVQNNARFDIIPRKGELVLINKNLFPAYDEYWEYISKHDEDSATIWMKVYIVGHNFSSSGATTHLYLMPRKDARGFAKRQLEREGLDGESNKESETD